ncbi:hypothetical protein BDN72DRAFT_833104 [Pluteus cervinus]|uniref:Uncharacterized protein n=1 Tax=Pluteus cervinus TaxID=181527 RepID=A0ACD3BAI5_9AGAR|nr:hypothetical protein BDN72DRAFT_833104 [Pluteus cervinus]
MNASRFIGKGMDRPMAAIACYIFEIKRKQPMERSGIGRYPPNSPQSQSPLTGLTRTAPYGSPLDTAAPTVRPVG